MGSGFLFPLGKTFFMNYHVATGLKIRMVTVLALIGIGAGGIILRAVQVQILEADSLRKIASRQHQHAIELRAQRGDILDQRGESLAVSEKRAQIYAHPEKVVDPAYAAKKLSSVLGKPAPELLKKLSSGDSFVWLTRNASLERAQAVKIMGLAGIGFLPASRRFYPGETLAANLIGFIGLDGKGLEGLEYYYDDVLTGKPARVWQVRDGRGNPIFFSESGSIDSWQPFSQNGIGRGQSVLSAFRHAIGLAAPGGPGAIKSDGENVRENFKPVPEPSLGTDSGGDSLKLTILRPLQYLVERELEKGIKSSGSKAGCVVAMEPDTGRVLALASWPTYDPNQFGKYSQKEFRNRCVASAYEPGSTFKVFIVAAALEEGVIRPDDRFFCENGNYDMGGEVISDTRAHGWLSVEDIIAYSSNIGASKIGESMGKKKMYRNIKAFGFGARTDIDFPGESAGLLRPSKNWSQVAVGTISFGQGIAVTPLQMASALSAVANGGNLMRPYLVQSLIRPDGTEKKLNAPKKVRRVIGQKSVNAITGFMEKAVRPGGTGKNAQVPGYSVAGKTGTSQKPKEKERGYAKGKYVASFMGFLPAKNPRLAMIVVIDEPDPERPWGGAVAAPIFQAIAKNAMILLKVPSEDEAPPIARTDKATSSNLTTKRIRRWEEKRAWNQKMRLALDDKKNTDKMTVPDLEGFTMRQALRSLEGMPVQVEVAGTGIVTNQSPEPGIKIKGRTTVKLNLEAIP